MKKKLLLSILAIAAMMVSCSKKEPVAKDEVSVTPSEVEVDYTEQEVQVKIKASGEWMLDGYSKWVKTTDTEGDGNATVTFSVKKNETGAAREYTFTVTCGKASADIVIKQSAEPVAPPEDVIALDRDKLDVEGVAGECKVKVVSTLDWTLTKNADWVSVDKTSGKNGDEVTISYTKNTGAEAREAKITFSIEGGKSAVFTLTQAVFVPEPDNISLNPATKNVTAASGSFDVNVTSTDAWTLSNTASWLSFDKTSGGNGTTVTVSYTANEESEVRSATVTFTCGTATAELKINQNPESAKEPLSLKSGTTAKNVYLNQHNSDRTITQGGSRTWEIVDNDQEWTATLFPEGAGASLTVDAANHKVSLTVDAHEVNRLPVCWTITLARPADTQPLVLCVYQQRYIKNSKPSLHAYDYTANTFVEGTYAISSMDSNTTPFTLWNGISSSEARTYDLQCYLWTRSATDVDPASFWYPDLGRISSIRLENLFDIKSKGDGTYTIRPAGNTACGLGEVDGKLMIAAECVNASWRITRASNGWTLQCGSKYMTVSAGQGGTSTAYKAISSCTAQQTLSLGASANSTASNYIRLFKAAYADTHAGDKDSLFSSPDTDLEVAAAGGSQEVTLYSTGSWTASSSASWVTLTANSGNKVTDSVKFSVASNGTGAARSAVITVVSNGSECKINVNQK